MNIDLILYPAYYLEHVAFETPPQNVVARQIVPRIIAVAVPIFYAYQTLLYASVSLIDCALCACFTSPGVLCQFGIVHTGYSIRNLASSLMEIPEKLLFGSNCRPNYCGDHRRYVRKDLSEDISLI